MPLPLILGGVAATAGAALIKAVINKKSGNVYFFIKNKRSMYFNGMLEKRFLFIKYQKPQWVSHYDDALGFDDEEEADDCIQQNRLRGVEIIEKRC
ncbi:MAG: hypothetical protein LBH44_01920 [Treponema sp.]|jgi:hypothetical protein|nr:hypothetical protein [Treponema sp.]